MHLCFSISAHGFGHGAISCSVINRLMTYYPHIKISIMTLLPKSYLDSRLTGNFDYYEVGSDFGMLMSSPICIDIENSRQKYQLLLDNWQSCVDSEKKLLVTIKPDILISNISPISLDAAHQLGIKTASVAPFNWAQIYQVYCLDDKAETKAVYQKMYSVYQAVGQVFKPLPFVPLNDGNEIEIASINDEPRVDLAGLLKQLPLNTQKIGLIALGGLPFPLDLQNWPKKDGLHWLVDQTIPISRTDMTQIVTLKVPFIQLVAASDFIITKPGYGTYCEIAAIAKHKKIKVMSLVRPDWPETPYLNKFLRDRVPFVEVEEKQLAGQDLKGILEKLINCDYPDEFPCEDGAMQLVALLVIPSVFNYCAGKMTAIKA
jgi:predicted DNA-binding antitoxin AbrB/MazE fold protein